MLDMSHWSVNQLFTTLQENAEIKRKFDLIECLKPELTIENDKYVYSYMDIVRGEGSTVYEAMNDFVRYFYSEKLSQPINGSADKK